MLGAALEEQRKEGEYIEGIAIWVAVAIVIMVGEYAVMLEASVTFFFAEQEHSLGPCAASHLYLLGALAASSCRTASGS